jgi:Iap family predicted aminopeptidase/LysM repeat protein
LNRKIISLLLILSLILASFGFVFADSTYMVKEGDVLWKIAKQYGTTWQELAKYNSLVNPNLIYPNQKILIPDKTTVVEPKPEPSAWDQAMDDMNTLLSDMTASYIEEIDTNYAYDIAYQLSTNPKYHSSILGTRTAGSDAEHKAADYLLSVMKSLGLVETEKAAADVDKWQFNSAKLTLAGDDKVILPHSYATAATPKRGITAEIVYLGKGTMWDYEEYEGDITGKIVLVDVDMRADWWITYPMLEAEFQGAAAIMSSAVSGFSEISKDAYNCNDICAPTSIPCVNITQNDAEYIKAQIEEKGTITGTLLVDNVVEPGGTSYNVVGKIKGKSSDQQIIIGTHYDTYFQGFQDNSCAVGLVLAMAKAMKDSGYVPENDIIFCLHGAEEWGATNTQFDWTIGAWQMINRVHPEWAGKTLAFINFELPAFEFDTYTSVYSAPELYSLIDTFVNEGFAPKPVDCFPDGVLTEGYQTYTYSDDFSYYAAGVPSTVNGFLLQQDMENVFPFYYDYYHSNFDAPDTYNEAVMKFNTEFYGALAIFIDKTPALKLDYTSQYDRLSSTLNEEIAVAAGADVAAYKAALAELDVVTTAASKAIDDLNMRYINAVIAGAEQKVIDAIIKEGRDLNAKNLKIFKYVQDEFLGLMYERPIVPHEAPQENIALMEAIVDALAEGDVVTAADEYAWAVNNVFEWYAMYFSPEVMDIHYDMFYGEDNQDNLFWGTNKAFVPAEVEESTRSLFLRYEEVDGDFTTEIAIYEAAIAAQQAVLKDLITKETIAIKELIKMLK